MENIEKAISVLNNGGIVIFPTDTVYGMGCRIDNEQAIKRLFVIRKRPETQATPVLVDSTEMAKKYFSSPLPDNVRRLMKKYWPGGLTIIYPCKTELVPMLVRGSGDNLGVRMPNHDLTLALVKNIGVPILGPSANFHGDQTPYKYKDLDQKLVESVDYVIKGKCNNNIASTVIDCSLSPWQIKRFGAVQLTTLSIDTTDNKKIVLSLTFRRKLITTAKAIDTWTSQFLLPTIDLLLKKNKLSLSDLDIIKVKRDEGSYTGIRVGLTVANTLGWLLDIPVD